MTSTKKPWPSFSKLLRYVGGDYQDPATFDLLKKTLGSATRPAHYLAIPPGLFMGVVESVAKSNCMKSARVIVEKPFGQDLASAQQLNAALHAVLPESRIFGSTTTWVRGSPQSSILSLRQ